MDKALTRASEKAGSKGMRMLSPTWQCLQLPCLSDLEVAGLGTQPNSDSDSLSGQQRHNLKLRRRLSQHCRSAAEVMIIIIIISDH